RRNAAGGADAGAPAASAARRRRWAAAAGGATGAPAAAVPARPARPDPPAAATRDSCLGAPGAGREQRPQRLDQRLVEDVHGMADPGLGKPRLQLALRLAEPGEEAGAQGARVARQRLAGFRIDEAAPVVEREVALGHG